VVDAGAPRNAPAVVAIEGGFTVRLAKGRVLAARRSLILDQLPSRDRNPCLCGFVTTDAVGQTSTRGVWAAGNVVDPRAQVITAAGAGSVAAIAINADLVQEDAERAAEDQRLAAGASSP
jgi:hypothetical protein